MSVNRAPKPYHLYKRKTRTNVLIFLFFFLSFLDLLI